MISEIDFWHNKTDSEWGMKFRESPDIFLKKFNLQ